METTERFRILTVCTGNVCRSPVSELLLQSGLDELHPGKFSVRSAGTHALVGQPMQPLSAEIVNRYGSQADTFASRQLTSDMVREADLVLAMAAEHRSRILQLEPAALRRTFTLREFGRMLEHLAEEGLIDAGNDVVALWHHLPAAAAAVRHRSLAEALQDNDIVDPYHCGAATYREMENQLVPALSSIFSVAELGRARKQGRRRAG